MKRRRSLLVALALLACTPAAAQETPGNDIPEPQAWVRVSQIYLTETGDAELTGVGLSLRVRVRWLGMAAWLDVATGRDKYATRRTEASFGCDMLFFLNPPHEVQLFGFVGFGGTAVSRSERWTDERTQDKQLQIGLGLEFPITQRLALDLNFATFSRSLANADGVKQNTDGGRERVPGHSYGVMLQAATGFDL